MHGLEFAWRAHTAAEQTIARVDAKAATVVTIEGIVVAAVVGALNNAAFLAMITGWRCVLVAIGTVASLIAILIAIHVVFPRLRSGGPDAQVGVLYFGHLRKRDAGDLARRIRALSDREQAAELADQLTRIGAVCWRKHRLLQAAIVVSVVGLAVLLTGILWPIR